MLLPIVRVSFSQFPVMDHKKIFRIIRLGRLGEVERPSGYCLPIVTDYDSIPSLSGHSLKQKGRAAVEAYTDLNESQSLLFQVILSNSGFATSCMTSGNSMLCTDPPLPTPLLLATVNPTQKIL
jgi:hypothetical protein